MYTVKYINIHAAISPSSSSPGPLSNKHPFFKKQKLNIKFN